MRDQAQLIAAKEPPQTVGEGKANDTTVQEQFALTGVSRLATLDGSPVEQHLFRIDDLLTIELDLKCTGVELVTNRNGTVTRILRLRPLEPTVTIVASASHNGQVNQPPLASG